MSKTTTEKEHQMTNAPMTHPLDTARDHWDALLNRYVHIEAAARAAVAAASWDEAQSILREALDAQDAQDARPRDIVPILDGDLNPL